MLLDSKEAIGDTNKINTKRRGTNMSRKERIFVCRNDLLRLSLRGTPSLVISCPLEFIVED